MDWSTIYDTAQQWGLVVHQEFKQWGWYILGLAILSWQLRRIDEDVNKMKIAASRTIENGIVSPKELSIRYLISIDAKLEKIVVVLILILLLGATALLVANQGVR